MMVLTWLVVLLISLEEVLALSSCQQLYIHRFTAKSQPTSGEDLPFCSTSDMQCCTSQYLSSLSDNLTLGLMEGAQNDLALVFSDWLEGYATITENVDDILDVFVDQLPFPHSFNPSAIAYLNNTVKNVLIHHIHPQYQLDVTFNFRDFILNFTTNLIHLFTHSIPYSFQQQECLNEILHDHLNHTAITAVSDNFRSLQYIFQSFKNIQTYMANFNISHFYAPSEECIQALMLQHCSSCVRDIPAMCQMTCELITGTCQSPIYDGLKYQLEAVWNVSSQLVQQLKYITHKTLLTDTLNILPARSIHSLNAQSNQQCNIDLLSLLSSRRKRNADDIISDFSLSHAKMNSLPRVFKYGDGIVSSNFCMKRSSSTNCWNISHILSHSSLIPYNISISDQTNNNNAFQFDVASLNQQASCIGKPFMELLHDNTDLLSLRLNISIPSVVLPPTVSSNVCATPTTTTTSATTHSTPSTQPIDIVGTPNAAHSLYQLTFLILLSLLLALLLT